jgi:hypothetical protein
MPKATGDPENIEQARAAICRASRLLEEAGSEEPQQVIWKSRAAMAELERVEYLLAGVSPRAPHGDGARGRILAYFLYRGVDVPVRGDELRRVSGIQEWARRVRELRVEEGWDIRYDGNVYRLRSVTANKEIAAAWRLAQSIRKSALSARDRILQYLQARVGEIVDSELLKYVSGVQEHGQPIRELRCELGYSISTHIDRPNLKAGEYVLESAEPSLNVSERQISDTLRQTVFERDGYRCVLCGVAYGPRVLLTAHLLVARTGGGSDNDPEDFVTLCDRDHAAITGAQQEELMQRRRRRVGEKC